MSTMNCQDAEKLLPLHAGEDLPQAQAAVVRQHLQGCERCRTSLDALKSTRQWVRGYPGASLNGDAYADLRASIRRRIAEQPPPRSFLWAWLGRAWAWYRGHGTQPTLALAMAAVLLVATGTVGWNLRPGTPPQTLAPVALAPPPAPPVPAVAEGGDLLASAADVTAVPEDDATPTGGLRMELQTSDPNVRIIWFGANAGTRN